MSKTISVREADTQTPFGSMRGKSKEFKVLWENDDKICIITETRNNNSGSYSVIDKKLKRSEDYKYWLNEEDYNSYFANKKLVEALQSKIYKKVNDITGVKTLETINNYIDNVEKFDSYWKDNNNV